jgi:hypothetical protein
VEIVTLETMKKRHFSNGRNYSKNFSGQITEVVDENETYLRQNFDK